jgi:hypothetical protein
MRHIGDFSNWKAHDSYRAAFQRLLRDLKAEDGRNSSPAPAIVRKSHTTSGERRADHGYFRVRKVQEQSGTGTYELANQSNWMHFRSILTRPLHLIDNKHLDPQSC